LKDRYQAPSIPKIRFEGDPQLFKDRRHDVDQPYDLAELATGVF